MINICQNPLITHRLNMMRDKATPPAQFRRLLREVSLFLTYEAVADFDTVPTSIQTPLEEMQSEAMAHPSPVLVSILRAGNGFLDGALEVLPEARVGFLGMYRDEETLRPVDYYANLPADLSSSPVIVLDPMLATGHSAVGALKYLRDHGAKDIRFICLVAAPEGIETLQSADNGVKITTASIDRQLNENGYIVPGLGDAGDRIFNSL